MPKASLIVLLLMVVWTAFSWHWYTCGIKGFCSEVELDVTITRHAAATSQESGAQPVEAVCLPFLETKMSLYKVNDTEEVQKLNYFLSEYENLPVSAASSVFDSDTQAAVNQFQLRYSEKILAPYGLTKPTGNVYTKTTETINGLYCKKQGM